MKELRNGCTGAVVWLMEPGDEVVTAEDMQQRLSVVLHPTRQGLRIHCGVLPVSIHPETANVVRVARGSD